MKTKTIIIIICVVVISAAALLCFLTWPERSEMELYGVYTHADGTQNSNLGTITFRVTRIRKLIGSDRLHIEIELPEQAKFRVYSYESGSLIENRDIPDVHGHYIITTVPCYSPAQDEPGFARLAYDTEAGLLLLEDPFREGYFIAASVEEGIPVSDILDYFQGGTQLSDDEE